MENIISTYYSYIQLDSRLFLIIEVIYKPGNVYKIILSPVYYMYMNKFKPNVNNCLLYKWRPTSTLLTTVV